ncbi:unnamed protein product [Rhizophagus irregularis]|nr:unnamed protein product [Rhizophagus irregularis]
MTNPAGDSPGTTTLQLQDIIDTSGDTNSNRRKRAISNHTATITNDTQDVMICTFSPSASAAGGRILAVGSYGFAAAGFVAMVPTFPTPLAWGIAIASYAIAILGVIDVVLAAADPTT